MNQISLLSCLLLSLLLLSAQRCSEDYEMPHSLYGSWVHSHEEDHGGNLVYRPASYNFPPSRGREKFDIKPGGALLYYGIAPADGMATPEEGSWQAINERTIEVHLPQNEAQAFSAELVEVSNDRLVLRKLPDSRF